MKTAMAGTLESMDCLVTVTEAAPGSGITLNLEGSSVARFRSSMEKTIGNLLNSMNVKDMDVKIQDHGALDIVLEARVETALKRYGGER